MPASARPTRTMCPGTRASGTPKVFGMCCFGLAASSHTRVAMHAAETIDKITQASKAAIAKPEWRAAYAEGVARFRSTQAGKQHSEETKVRGKALIWVSCNHNNRRKLSSQ